MADRARAEAVRQAVVQAAAGVPDRELRIERSWVEAEDIICFVYEAIEHPDGLTGLRRTIEQGPEWTVAGIVDEILTCELGEPLGSCADTLVADADGVRWWTGNREEWKDPR